MTGSQETQLGQRLKPRSLQMLLCSEVIAPSASVLDLNSGSTLPEACSLATCFLLPSPQRPETHPRSEIPGQCHRVPTPWGCRPVPSVCCFPWASHHLATPASLALPSPSDPRGFSECTVGQAPAQPTFPEPLPRHSPGPKLGPCSHRVRGHSFASLSPKPAGESWAWGQPCWRPQGVPLGLLYISVYR